MISSFYIRMVTIIHVRATSACHDYLAPIIDDAIKLDDDDVLIDFRATSPVDLTGHEYVSKVYPRFAFAKVAIAITAHNRANKANPIKHNMAEEFIVSILHLAYSTHDTHCFLDSCLACIVHIISDAYTFSGPESTQALFDTTIDTYSTFWHRHHAHRHEPFRSQSLLRATNLQAFIPTLHLIIRRKIPHAENVDSFDHFFQSAFRTERLLNAPFM